MAEPKDNKSGRVRHEASGRAVWEWAIDTGRHALESTSRLLKRLEMPGLALEDEVKKRDQEARSKDDEQPPPPTFGGARESDPLAGSRKSFDPYDNRAPPRRGASAVRPATRPAAATPVKPNPKPGLFSRLFNRR